MNEDTFPGIYHSLIHSSHLNTLLQLEHTYGIAIQDIMKARDNALEMLQKRFLFFYLYVRVKVSIDK